MSNPSDPPLPPTAPDPLAVALARLDPAPHGLEWHALMFAAGRESKARELRAWRAVAIACALLACGFAAAFFVRPTVVIERPVFVDRPAPRPQPAPPLSGPGPGPVLPPKANPDSIPKPAPDGPKN
jgi:hypothetical protein